ncbi:hypothetical protein RIF29_29684 [Crotalaria pallida]|uniref:Uncharacterized protein n=1 Tax=Crotalaria pallida TaxID=3830 RepID=A0AAN9EK65_CROPI
MQTTILALICKISFSCYLCICGKGECYSLSFAKDLYFSFDLALEMNSLDEKGNSFARTFSTVVGASSLGTSSYGYSSKSSSGPVIQPSASSGTYAKGIVGITSFPAATAKSTSAEAASAAFKETFIPRTAILSTVAISRCSR